MLRAASVKSVVLASSLVSWSQRSLIGEEYRGVDGGGREVESSNEEWDSGITEESLREDRQRSGDDTDDAERTIREVSERRCASLLSTRSRCVDDEDDQR
jgi:hypothetical protein